MAKLKTALPARYEAGKLEAGCDEAGRGPLAGGVFAAAVILPEDFSHPLLNDSKQMNERDRETLREIIRKEAVAWAVEMVSAEEIDRINILNASITGMWRAVTRLQVRPEALIVDGNKFKDLGFLPEAAIAQEYAGGQRLCDCMDRWKGLPWNTFVKGDGRFASIAAASVLAKTYRDDYMRSLAKEYPEYGWDSNMGYPTASHIEAIRKYGFTPHHRRTFHVKELENTLF
ncbi:MAG: ribonuclease HII [Rikenellaceae bacterium]|nr:ribonuclease HII [Rikenellaceae bacterium]